MIDHNQLREYVIKPALTYHELWSPDAEELLIFTCAVESLGGTYLHQIEGPALGAYQMEPKTYLDIWKNYLFFRPQRKRAVLDQLETVLIPDKEKIITDLAFASVMCRFHYLRVSEPLPSWNDKDAIWEYYKEYYNTHLGKASKIESINKYLRFINPT